ncbi:hypothetical protein [Streptomyces sannanensis]|uniref:hypothetical protein n=1 Tax=Streptomyces sannanensis TaxID=285536 RepID=UPI0031E6253F
MLSPDPYRPATGEGRPDAAAAEEAAGKRGFLATVHGTATPKGAEGTVYRLFPGRVDGSGLRRVTAGDLVADPG